MKELEKLEEAIWIGRTDGRIDGIKKAFDAYIDSFLWERIKRFFKKEWWHK